VTPKLGRPSELLPVLLWTAGLSAIPSGVALRWLVPGAWDPLWARGLICVACLVLAEAVRRRVGRRLVRLSMRVLAVASGVWVVLLVWGNGFPVGASSGVLPLLAMCLLGFPTIAEALAFTVFFSALLAVAGSVSGHGLHAAGLVLSCLILGVVQAMSTAHRVAMARRLRRSRDQLEDVVAERTAELQTEIEIRRYAEAQAVASSEAKSRFLANMSHELRTPLNAIKGYAELCTEVVDDAQPIARGELRGDLARVTTSADRLLALVNDVLDLARIEAGMLDMHAERVEPAQLVRQVADELRPLVDHGGNELVLALDDLPDHMEVDPTRLRQVLVNLVGNATKFTEDGTIRVTGALDRGAVQLQVHDTGIGIPADALATLFDRFTQVDESPTRKHQGTGLGLALSRDLARRMGGELTARSEVGRGSVFTVRLPLSAPRPTPISPEPTETAATA